MLNLEVQARRLPYCFSGVNRETMIMLGAVSHIPEKSREAAFPRSLKITVCPPANAKKCCFRVNLTPHMPSCTAYLGGVLGQFWKGCGGSSVCVRGG